MPGALARLVTDTFLESDLQTLTIAGVRKTTGDAVAGCTEHLECGTEKEQTQVKACAQLKVKLGGLFGHVGFRGFSV